MTLIRFHGSVRAIKQLTSDRLRREFATDQRRIDAPTGCRATQTGGVAQQQDAPLCVVTIDALQSSPDGDIATLALDDPHLAEIGHGAKERLRNLERLVGLELALTARYTQRHQVVMWRQPHAITRRKLMIEDEI